MGPNQTVTPEPAPVDRLTLLAAFDDGSDTITVKHLDDVALSARAHAGEADLKTATPQTSRRRHVKVPVS